MAEKREDQQESSGRDGDLQTEYDTLTETLSALKIRAEQLRRDNDFLQNEVYQTRMESQEYMSYISKRTQKRQSAIVSLNDQSQKELEDLRRQREKALEKYQEQATELKREILQKENELARLNFEIAELRELESLKQQQLSRIAELEQEVAAMHFHHSNTLLALKARFLKEKKHYEAQAKHKVQEFVQTANKEAYRCLLSHMQEVSQENQRLRKELQMLIPRAHALRGHQQLLQTQHRNLLLEKEHMQKLYHLHSSTYLHTVAQEGTSAESTNAGAAATN
ncbi:coiled-coil domain-containing protein 166 [Salminus brasiliensis]|uniref:coiled-coil domain-containing protein 166 n=1 Tax=Salminus brasiliensis TaxID=930266 RepID=UPI003B83702F